MDFLIVNGEMLRKEDANFTPFLWGEPLLLSRKVWFGYGGIPMLKENVLVIREQIESLGATVPKLLKNNREFFRITKRMLNKNKFYRSGWIHVQLYITKAAVNFVITCNAVEEFEFPISLQGSLVHFSQIKKISRAPFNQFSFANRAIWMAEELHLRNEQLQNSFFLNENNAVCDAISANIYLIKNKMFITPALETGCLVDVLRKHILNIAAELNYSILEAEGLSAEEVFEMDEIFLAAEERGIEWILGIGNKRFVKKTSIVFHRKLNEFLKGKVH